MGRFSRRRARQEWVKALPDPFTLDDVMALVQREQFDAALSWLYDAILRGRVEPSRGGGRRISYNFIGERRAGDGSADRFTPQRVPQP